MKVFVIAVFLVAALMAEAKLTDEQKATVAARSKECQAASGVDAAVLEKARQGEFADDAKLKAHILCMSKKSGFQNDAGVLQPDVLKQKLGAMIDNADAASKLVDKCAVQKGTPEDTAVDTIKCYFATSPVRVSIF